jgi:hypothetical protein
MSFHFLTCRSRGGAAGLDPLALLLAAGSAGAAACRTEQVDRAGYQDDHRALPRVRLLRTPYFPE